MRKIHLLPKTFAVIDVPGSKSYTHRMLIAAALSDGICRIKNPLISDDTGFTADALKRMGIVIEPDNGNLMVEGTGGKLAPAFSPIYIGNSGTTMRLMTAVAAMGNGDYRLQGTPRMHRRPISDLIDSLNRLGVNARCVNNDGCPPVEVTGNRIVGGEVDVNCGVSSQFLTALLLIAPCTQNGLSICVSEGPVSKPYIDMTVEIMKRMGVGVERSGYENFHVPGGQSYRSGEYTVETDASNAGYFWAAAAITGSTVKVLNINSGSKQGDLRLTECLKRMGCFVEEDEEGISVTGNKLVGIETDMGDIPDMVPTLAVVAAFATGKTVIKNVSHLKAKECDRLAAVYNELKKMGINVRIESDALFIDGGTPRGATIETYDDHRIAMAFAVAGLAAPGITIANPSCVQKSFPGFWDAFDQLYPKR